MKQKIVINVRMDSDKSRSKALKTAAGAEGVSSVSIGGEDRDQVVVTGDGVDSVCLTLVLRKKFGYANVESVEEVKKENEKEKEKEKEGKPTELPLYYHVQYPQYPSHVVCDDRYNSNCTIM